MVGVTFDIDIAGWANDLRQIQRQIPFAASLALTETAKDTRRHHQEMLPMIFDRPTRFTLNYLQVVPSRKETMVARLEAKTFRNKREHYLTPNVEGGGRKHKGFERWLIGKGLMLSSEYAVPAGGARMNAFGNISPGQITQILSQLAASPDAMQWETARSRKRAGSKRGRYFVPQAGSGLARGVWMRTGARAIKPILLFVRAPGYTGRYDFDGITERHAWLVFPRFFDAAMTRALSRSLRP